ncbi:RNA-binding protein [bacterium]|nr:RNA-binding protein [bacterium]
MNIFVGNLSFDMTEDELREEFSQFGQISSLSILKDKMTNRSRGFAFVEMPNDEEANASIAALNGKSVKGRQINVAEARPREERSRDSKPRSNFNRNRSW